MDILHLCPGGLATGGTEGIHNLVHHLNCVGANAKVFYTTCTHDPQPKEFAKYECEYVTEMPKDFDGVVIFPEIWANRVVEPQFADKQVAVNWQGVDVYYWHNPKKELRFLERPDTIHIANSAYAMWHLKEVLKVNPIKISDCLNDDFFEPFEDNHDRGNVVLYNPTSVKMTYFQQLVMGRCRNELGIKFLPLEGYSRQELIEIFRKSKLYIDFGVFSGRERLPREAVTQGCCILTSITGTAGYYEDNSILDMYKEESVDGAIRKVQYILNHYRECRADFDLYRALLKKDKENYVNEVRGLYNAFLDNHSGT